MCSHQISKVSFFKLDMEDEDEIDAMVEVKLFINQNRTRKRAIENQQNDGRPFSVLFASLFT